jgi:hypothetical protein
MLSALRAFFNFSSPDLSSSKIELISSVNLTGITYLSSSEFSKSIMLVEMEMLLRSL